MMHSSAFDAFNTSHVSNVVLSNTNMQYMVRWSHRIEDRMLTERSGTLLIGAQYLSNIVDRLPFYELLAERHQVILYALPDVSTAVMDKIHFMPLREHDLMMQEWFVVAQTLTYQRALIARERPHRKANQRRFQSLLVHNPQQINAITSRLLLDTVLVEA